jgi:ferredoxin-type protein NapF
MREVQSPARRNFLRGRIGSPPRSALPLYPRIHDVCIARHGVVCRSCGDACTERAIRFSPCIGGIALPEILVEACSGCGNCVTACPADAIQLKEAA